MNLNLLLHHVTINVIQKIKLKKNQTLIRFHHPKKKKKNFVIVIVLHLGCILQFLGSFFDEQHERILQKQRAILGQLCQERKGWIRTYIVSVPVYDHFYLFIFLPLMEQNILKLCWRKKKIHDFFKYCIYNFICIIHIFLIRI